MHIVSASRRTDIPAFHAEWFMNRVRAGRVGVGAPFGRGVGEVSLLPEDVAAIVFWTKDAGPLLPHLEELKKRGHCFSFLYTVNNYPVSLEPRVPNLSHTLRAVEILSNRFNPGVFRWRYDTIVLTEGLNQKWHLHNFSRLCKELSPHTSVCIFSFCDYYRKTIRNMNTHVPDHVKPDDGLCKDMAEEMAAIAGEAGITLASCAHDFLVSARVAKAHCIDPEALYPLVDTAVRRDALKVLKRAPTRRDCGCAASKDIGAYDTCGHGCAYCYANNNPEQAARNLASIGPDRYCLDSRYADVSDGE
jgi:hypothetical protein